MKWKEQSLKSQSLKLRNALDPEQKKHIKYVYITISVVSGQVVNRWTTWRLCHTAQKLLPLVLFRGRWRKTRPFSMYTMCPMESCITANTDAVHTEWLLHSERIIWRNPDNRATLIMYHILHVWIHLISRVARYHRYTNNHRIIALFAWGLTALSAQIGYIAP